MFQIASLTDVDWPMSGEVVLMTLVGGLGTVFGPVVGAFVIIAMQNYLAQVGQWVTVIQGVVFVACVLLFRRGIIGELANLLRIRLVTASTKPRKTSMCAEARLKQLGIVLPELMVPVANYLPYRIAGNILYLAGQGPRENGKILLGKVGTEVSIEEGYRRARLTGLGMLSAMKAALGSLDRVDYIVKLLGMVNAPPDFKDQPKVINGCSDLFVEVFGDAGKARPLGGRHGLAAERDVGRDRRHHRHQALSVIRESVRNCA